MRWPRWFIRPATIGDRTIHANAHVPKYGYLVQHLLTGNQAVVLRALEHIAGKRRPDNSWLAKDASITEITIRTARYTAEKTALNRKAVRNALRALEAKHVIRCWNVGENRPGAARRRGDGRFKTCWLVLAWTETLKAIADDARIWNPKNRSFFVVGRSKKLVTPEEAAAWKLNEEQAKDNPRAWAYSVPAGDEDERDALPAAAPRKAGRNEISRDLKEICRRYGKPGEEEIRSYVSTCRREAAHHGADLADEDIAAILAAAAARIGNVRHFGAFQGSAAAQTQIYLGRVGKLKNIPA